MVITELRNLQLALSMETPAVALLECYCWHQTSSHPKRKERWGGEALSDQGCHCIALTVEFSLAITNYRPMFSRTSAPSLQCSLLGTQQQSSHLQHATLSHMVERLAICLVHCACKEGGSDCECHVGHPAQLLGMCLGRHNGIGGTVNSGQ